MKLKDYRTKKGLSLRDVEKLVGISNSYLCLLENNKRKPNIKTLKILASAYKVKLSSIVRCFE